MILPIWKDCIVNLGERSVAEYRIAYVHNDSIVPIYSGKAHQRPDEQNIRIRINDVCADWLTNSFPSLAKSFSYEEMPVEFVVQLITDAGQYVGKERVQFLNDWSYDDEHDAERDGLASPINGRIDIRQWLMITALNKEVVEAQITLRNGTSFNAMIPIAVSADFNNDYNEDFADRLKSAGSGTAVFNLSQWGDVVKAVVNGVTYEVVGCSRYVLYYLNAFGGWDSLLIEGMTSERDTLTRHTRKVSAEYKRQQDNYLNEIQKKFTMNTSWLSDDESARMHHLLNSTDVYMHDLDKDVILPVVIEGTETPYKTYKGNGCQLTNYTIDVVVAQTRMRR